MNTARGSSLAETIISCALFSVFMVVALGLFNGMTKVVKHEQQPAERLTEGRLAALAVARRLRNCQGFVRPTLREVLAAPSEALLLRDVVKERTVELKVDNEVLFESYYPFLYDPLKPGHTAPEKALRLCGARSFRLVSGGFEFPTRVTVEIVLTDGRLVQAVSNFREAI
jgi:hypothetical protein